MKEIKNVDRCIFCNAIIPEGRHICPNCEAERLEKTRCKSIFVCSPYRGDVEKNEMAAIGNCREIALRGFIPVAPHLYFTRFLNDGIEAERKLGMRLGKSQLLKCAEVWVFGEHISDGMKEEIQIAVAHGIPVKRVLLLENNDIVLRVM